MRHPLVRIVSVSAALASLTVFGCSSEISPEVSPEASMQALDLANAAGSSADDLPLAAAPVPPATSSTYYCCASGQDPIHNNCHQMLGPHGICLKIKWKCTSTSTATGCSMQFDGSQTVTSEN